MILQLLQMIEALCFVPCAGIKINRHSRMSSIEAVDDTFIDFQTIVHVISLSFFVRLIMSKKSTQKSTQENRDLPSYLKLRQNRNRRIWLKISRIVQMYSYPKSINLDTDFPFFSSRTNDRNESKISY
jgi:hypothetical protein